MFELTSESHDDTLRLLLSRQGLVSWSSERFVGSDRSFRESLLLEKSEIFKHLKSKPRCANIVAHLSRGSSLLESSQSTSGLVFICLLKNKRLAEESNSSAKKKQKIKNFVNLQKLVDSK